MLLLTPPVLNMGRMVTADPLSTAIIFLALFSLAKKRQSSAVLAYWRSAWWLDPTT